MFNSFSEKGQFGFKWHNLQQHANVMMQTKNETSPNSDQEESYLRGNIKIKNVNVGNMNLFLLTTVLMLYTFSTLQIFWHFFRWIYLHIESYSITKKTINRTKHII